MANAILTHLGRINGVGGTWEQENANFLTVFSGEVMNAFEANNIFKDLHRVRTIKNGKSASFSYLGTMKAKYHVRGEPILGSNNPKIGQRVINVDDLLISDIAIYDLDDAKLHFEVRQEYSTGLGTALANAYDKKLAVLGYLAARGVGVTSDYKGGTKVTHVNAGTDKLVLDDLIWKCAEEMDNKDVPAEDRNIIVKPTQYYMLLRNKDNLNSDWGGAGDYATAKIPKIANMNIHRSNNLPNGTTYTKQAGENNDYSGDFTKSVALIMNRQAIGTVKLFDLATEMTGKDFHAMYQATMIVAKYAMGHGVLRPESACEIATG